MPRHDPHSFSDFHQGRVQHVDLDLEVDFRSQRLHGCATLHMREPQAGPLTLDTRGLSIDGVRDARGSMLNFELGSDHRAFGRPLTIQRKEPTKRLAIYYETSPEATALQWLEPSQTRGGELPYLFSQCQPIHARSMVPLQDTAAVRFTYAARLTVPKQLVAVMSAAPGETADGGQPGTRTFSFSMPQPIPSYLLAIAVGNLQSADLGPRTRVYTEPEMLDAAVFEFAGVESMLSAAEHLFGPYLWERFDFVVMPPSFPYGGMENPRLTFLTPTLIAGDRSLVNVLAHELAHSWTGNLVTNATMNDFWLNEGFTVWAERRILEALAGPEAAALAWAIGRAGLHEDLQRFGRRSPFTRLRTQLDDIDPDDVYSRVPYEKGALFLALIEQTLGRERWDELVRLYLRRFAFCSVTTADFEAFMEKESPGALEAVDAASWIHGFGLPLNAPVIRSQRIESISEVATRVVAREKPDPAVLQSFDATDWQILLDELPRPLPHDDCVWLDEQFSLSDHPNSEVRFRWLVIAAASRYEPAFPAIHEFLGASGRMKFIKPLYRVLVDRSSTRALAERAFRAHSASYHPLAKAAIRRLLAG